MRTFTRAQIVSLLASGVDLTVAFILLRWAGVASGQGNSALVTFCGATGTLCGGVTHFMISRTWVFSAGEKKWMEQLNRYALVWVGNLALNAGGLYLLSRYTNMDHRIAKVVTSVVVAVCYNYILQKRYVFKH
ncbi:MAG: GtrA family protein [Bacteroidetes bacterium]|nr:GtrA family protein [Bacteroidota bacterium]